MATPAAQSAFAQDALPPSTTADAAIDAPAAQTHVVASTQHRFSFSGSTSEYFRIWLVSLALSVLTLGVYSAWGKVRKRQYLYHHTRLAGSGFEFRGSPLAILRGRVIALVLFGGLALSGHVLREAQIAFFVLIALLTPWIAVASARFNARNTYYRSVAFDFDGSLREALKLYLGFGAIVIVTLGIAYPWFCVRRARFMVSAHRYGATSFTTRIATGPFFLAYSLAFIAMVGAVVAGALMIGSMLARNASSMTGGYAAMALLYAGYIVVYAFLRAFAQNRIANGTRAGPLQLHSTLRGGRLAWIYVTNVLIVLATLGLATPWAIIRITRYRADTLALESAAPLESLPGAPGSSTSAIGSEVGDLFDVDVAL